MGGRIIRKNTELMAEADRIVKKQYPTAVQVEIHGTPSSGSADLASEVDHWRFVFTDIDGVSTITLDYFDGSFGEIARSIEPWTETEIRDLPRRINLDDAISLLRKAGYTEPFKSVTLRAPTIFPQQSEVSYAFSLDSQIVFISATTGEIVKAVDQA
jgi:hypothetical protein